MTASSTQPPITEVQTHLRALLAQPDAPTRPTDFGPWNGYLDELAAIPGLKDRRIAFDASAKTTPALRQMLNGQPPTAEDIITATDVLHMVFPAIRWAVPNLLPEGLTILAGRPKSKKSFLTLQLALAVATGGMSLGEQVEQGKALICAFEDGYRRLKDRMVAQHWPDTDIVQYIISPDELGGALDGAGLAGLEKRIVEHGITYCVIDTLSRAVGGIKDQNDMSQATAALSGLQTIAIKHRVAIVVVHHTTKSSPEDFLDSVSGSTGFTAVADGIMVLKRKRGQSGATLEVVSRDLGSERKLALEWDQELVCWQKQGEGDEVEADTVQGEILEAMRVLDTLEIAATPSTIADHLKRDRGNVHRELAELLNKHRIIRGRRRGTYILAADTPLPREVD